MTGKFYVCPFAKYPGETNMALDLFFFREFDDEIILRFYGWERPTLSFGRNSFRPRLVDLDFCDANGIDRVMRPTGGKTVLHDRELTYSISAPVEAFPPGILETYKFIGGWLAAALGSHGLAIEISPEKSTAETNVCFHETAAFELRSGGRKLVGSAQKRGRKRFLQHGSVLMELQAALWSKIWKNASEETTRLKATCLSELLNPPPDVETLSRSIAREFAANLNRSPEEFEITPEILARARRWSPPKLPGS